MKRRWTCGWVCKFLDFILHLKASAAVGFTVIEGRLIIKPQAKPHYTFEELLAQCHGDTDLYSEEQRWLGAQAIGREIF
ncbi:antitoxin [Acetobacteraceae bacterium ESL0709]|nr:antitoxin [Acetobacteraceae bacterium ESL0709]